MVRLEGFFLDRPLGVEVGQGCCGLSWVIYMRGGTLFGGSQVGGIFFFGNLLYGNMSYPVKWMSMAFLEPVSVVRCVIDFVEVCWDLELKEIVSLEQVRFGRDERCRIGTTRVVGRIDEYFRNGKLIWGFKRTGLQWNLCGILDCVDDYLDRGNIRLTRVEENGDDCGLVGRIRSELRGLLEFVVLSFGDLKGDDEEFKEAVLCRLRGIEAMCIGSVESDL